MSGSTRTWIGGAINVDSSSDWMLTAGPGNPTAEGFLRSIADVLRIDIAIPDYTTLSRPGGGVAILLKRIRHAEPLHLLVDSIRL
jgi:hypothetical protein